MLFPLPPFPQIAIFFIPISFPPIDQNGSYHLNAVFPRKTVHFASTVWAALTHFYTRALHDASDDPVGLPFPVEKHGELPQLLLRHGDEHAARGRRTCAKGSGPILDAQPVPLANAVKRIFSIQYLCKPSLH